MNMSDQLHICDDAEALAHYARDWLVRLWNKHVMDNGQKWMFSIALSGGTTPKRLFQLLGELPAGTIDWKQVLLLWGDERNVPVDSPESNYRMVKESLLDHIDIPPGNVLATPDPGGAPERVAESYERLLRESQLKKKIAWPAIDCVLLGLGDDVHTASLFPGTEALKEKSRWVVANFVPQLDCWRITLTPPAINASRNVVFLLSGVKKQDALAKLWHAQRAPVMYPAQLIRPGAGQLWYLMDKDALGSTPLPESIMAQIIR
jgi:6-phosphogluconolactonase